MSQASARMRAHASSPVLQRAHNHHPISHCSASLQHMAACAPPTYPPSCPATHPHRTCLLLRPPHPAAHHAAAAAQQPLQPRLVPGHAVRMVGKLGHYKLASARPGAPRRSGVVRGPARVGQAQRLGRQHLHAGNEEAQLVALDPGLQTGMKGRGGGEWRDCLVADSSPESRHASTARTCNRTYPGKHLSAFPTAPGWDPIQLRSHRPRLMFTASRLPTQRHTTIHTFPPARSSILLWSNPKP